MSENELQARGQGFFGNRAAVLEPTELLNRPASCSSFRVFLGGSTSAFFE